MTVEETFHIMPLKDIWIDFVCVWRRCDKKEDTILVSDEIRNKHGPLQLALHEAGATTVDRFRGAW